MTISRSETFGSARRRCFEPVAPVASLRRSSNQTRRASSPAAPSSAPRAKEAGRYRLGRRLGAGGTAEVYEALLLGAEGFTRTVAVKRLLAGLEATPHYVAMFLHEAWLAARFSHPNLVSILDFDRDEEARPFLVMERVLGIDIAELVQVGPVPYPVAIFIASEMLSGLGYLHDLPGGGSVPGLVHRDLSPHNVLLSWEGAVKIADFGIAKAIDGFFAPASYIIRGTTGYMSPEQVNSEELDGRSDLFTVGVLLWELLVGRKLFVGTSRESMAQVLFQAIERPGLLRPGVPDDLEWVVMRLLARDRTARYGTAALALDELTRCRDAPRNGRGELARYLAERFPAAAASRTRTRERERTGGTVTRPPPPQQPPLWQQRAEAAERRERAVALINVRRRCWWMWILVDSLAFIVALALALIVAP